MFAPTKILLQKAQRGKYAVPHFNVNNMEMVQGAVQAAIKLKSPVILAASEGAVNYAGIDYLSALAKTAAESAPIPIAFHLDHGKNWDLIKKAIKMGFSSVMIDASHEQFEKNIRKTKQVVQLAHHKNISVEAELGTIGGAEDLVSSRRIIYTELEKAKEFVDRTNCDFLAVAIGTSHGAYKFAGPARLNLLLLKKISSLVKIPLVLHGASGIPAFLVKEAQHYGAKLKGMQGIPDTQLKEAIKLGITKVNTDTDLRLAFAAAARKAAANSPADIDPRHVLGPAREMMQKVAEQRIKLLGSAGKGK